MKNDDFVGMIDEISEAEEYGISEEAMAAPEPTEETDDYKRIRKRYS